MAEEINNQQITEVPLVEQTLPQEEKIPTYDFLTVNEEKPPENLDNKENTVIEENYPSWLPDSFKLPKEFKNDKEALTSYKEAYTNMINMLQSEEFETSLQEAYKDTLVNQDWEVKNLKALDQALKGQNKEQILKVYFPELLENIGRSPFMSREEKITFIDTELQKEFGNDYRQKYDANEAIEPESFSNQVFARQSELMQDLNKREAEYKEKNKPITPEVIEQQLMKSYNDQFKEDGFTVEEYRTFVDETKKFNPSMADIHHMLYFDHYIEEAREEGRKEGISSLKNGIKRVTTQDIEKEEKRIIPKEEFSGDYEEMRQNFYRTKK